MTTAKTRNDGNWHCQQSVLPSRVKQKTVFFAFLLGSHFQCYKYCLKAIYDSHCEDYFGMKISGCCHLKIWKFCYGKHNCDSPVFVFLPHTLTHTLIKISRSNMTFCFLETAIAWSSYSGKGFLRPTYITQFPSNEVVEIYKALQMKVPTSESENVVSQCVLIEYRQ